MRGEILHYDETQGFGFITGSDGQQYACAREDFRQPFPKIRGAAVEFQPSQGQARLIRAAQEAQEAALAAPMPVPPRPSAAVAPSPSVAGEPTLLDPVAATPQPAAAPAAAPAPWTPAPAVAAPARRPAPLAERTAYPAAPNDTGLWHYFWRSLTTCYVGFEGRARRKEYWGFVLFSTIVFTALIALGLLLDFSAGNVNWNNPTIIFSWALPGLWFLATILPGIAVTIRRQHDIGISGWFYLLVLLPSVGGLIILVFALIPSQRHDNKWGPVPTGVFVPPSYYAEPFA